MHGYRTKPNGRTVSPMTNTAALGKPNEDVIGSGPVELRLSTCKTCRHGVFKHQPHEWRNGRSPGWYHQECEPA
jgi:hypothetical protein